MAFPTYTCAQCGETFASDWSAEAAAKEYGEVFPAPMRDGQPPVAVCDVCYRRMIAAAPPAQLLAAMEAMEAALQACLGADTPELRRQYLEGRITTGFGWFTGPPR